MENTTYLKLRAQKRDYGYTLSHISLEDNPYVPVCGAKLFDITQDDKYDFDHSIECIKCRKYLAKNNLETFNDNRTLSEIVSQEINIQRIKHRIATY